MSFEQEFLEHWTKPFCEPPPTDSTEWQEYAKEAGEGVTANLLRQYVSTERDNPVLRLSSLGKSSIVELLAKKFGLLPQGSDETVNEQQRSLFLVGDIFEHTVMFNLKRWGFKIISTQEDINWHGISGHSDAVVETPSGERCLLEFKTANEYYYKSVHKSLGDERGYLTQLCCYSDALQLPAYWLFVNKNTSEIYVKPLVSIPEQQRVKALKRALGIVKAYDECTEYEDFPLFCNVPPPKIECYKDKTLKYWEDGSLKMYVPDHSFGGRPELFYKVNRVKNDYHVYRNYVTDFVGYDKFPDKKPDIQKFALSNWSN
jgi:hypothetical protein